MTREEAINKWIVPAIKNTWRKTKCKEIMQALEQEPCEDCINRAEALKNLALTNGKDDVYRMINSLPSIQPKPIQSDEDCISRQATVERLCKVADFMNEKRSGLGSPYIMVALFIQDNKDEFPSVTPKPKTDVLDKIRAEIKEVQTYKMFEGEDTVYVERKDVLAIIDKCKAEKE